MNTNTKWIWKNNENNANTCLNFVKIITLDSVPKRAVANIAVDSKYWLYINGSLAVFEGGVKRGPSRNSTYYDASKALGDWYAPGFDTSDWNNADVVGDAGVWGELCERIIPQFKDWRFTIQRTEFRNMSRSVG